MRDDGRVPSLTYAGMARAGRAIASWVMAEQRARYLPFSENWGRPRLPEFPTVSDQTVIDMSSDESLRAPEEPDDGRFALAFVLLGLAGVLALCATYALFVLWLLVLAGVGISSDLLPITITIAAPVSLVLALMGNRWIPERFALLLIVVTPIAVSLVVRATLGGRS